MGGAPVNRAALTIGYVACNVLKPTPPIRQTQNTHAGVSVNGHQGAAPPAAQIAQWLANEKDSGWWLVSHMHQNLCAHDDQIAPARSLEVTCGGGGWAGLGGSGLVGAAARW